MHSKSWSLFLPIVCFRSDSAGHSITVLSSGVCGNDLQIRFTVADNDGSVCPGVASSGFSTLLPLPERFCVATHVFVQPTGGTNKRLSPHLGSRVVLDRASRVPFYAKGATPTLIGQGSRLVARWITFCSKKCSAYEAFCGCARPKEGL